MELEIEGLRNLRVDFARASAKAGDGVMKGLQNVGLEIVEEAKLNLERNGTNNRRTLSGSGKVQKDKDGVDAGFFGKDSKHSYAAAVEYGRGPTQKASTDGITLAESLQDWVKRKLGGGARDIDGRKNALKSAAVFAGMSTQKYIESVAYLIARKIHRKGTKPQPFFTPAVKKFEDKVSNIVSEYVDKSLK
jgi:hypothetical protein